MLAKRSVAWSVAAVMMGTFLVGCKTTAPEPGPGLAAQTGPIRGIDEEPFPIETIGINARLVRKNDRRPVGGFIAYLSAYQLTNHANRRKISKNIVVGTSAEEARRGANFLVNKTFFDKNDGVGLSILREGSSNGDFTGSWFHPLGHPKRDRNIVYPVEF